MKKTVIYFCFFVYMLMNFTSTVCAKDGYYSCDSDPTEFNGSVFDKLTIDTAKCGGSILMLKNITVTDDVHLTGCSVFFAGSDLNRVHLDCPFESHCEIGLDGETGLKELDLLPGVASSVTVSGLMQTDDQLPSFYSKGYLCEGQLEFAVYTDSEISIDYQLQDLETFAALGKIDTIRIHAADDAAVTFDNVWLHRAFITDDDHSSRNFTVNTSGFSFIDMLDSGISLEIFLKNERQFL